MDAAGARLWVGGYTPPNGVASGIGALTVDGSARVRVAGVAAGADSPSFLAAHPSQAVVYAVAESEQTVRAYRGAGEGRLDPVGEPWPAGEAACHVAVDPLGRYLVVACWGSGQVLLYELDERGGIVSRFDSAPAVDPYPGAERVSRAHAALILPDGRVLTSDLGFDLLRVWTWQPGVGLVADGEVPLGAGSGPRHLALHPAGFVYVVTEYSIEVLILAPDDTGRFTLLGRTPARAGGRREGGDAAAEISIDEAGRRVYVTVRGSNVVSTLVVQDGGSRLEPLGDVASGGDWPRHHLLRGAWLHVANERSSTVTTFRLDPATGLPAELVDTAEVGSPTCLLERR